MKHTFRPDPAKGTHVRLSDSVRGTLHTFPDTVTVEPVAAMVSAEDFAEYIDTTPPAVISPPVPAEVANWRARAVLELAGLLPSVEAALGAMTGSEGIVARAAWQAGAPFVRNGPTVASIATALSLTSEQVDAMFVQAAALIF